MNTKFAGILILVCACVAVFVLALTANDSSLVLSQEGVATMGQVTSIEPHDRGASGVLYEIKFSFDAEGKPRLGWTILGPELASPLKVGSEVPVVYKSGKPNLAKLGKPGKLWDSKDKL